ncbi:MAG: hypothetical protein HC905_20700 [Bacteroidales bacterium]|nr:hypothetical protein [Bacteroidales bacterium]
MSGAISVNANVHQIELMKEFGFNFGLAWHLKQDIEALHDYKSEVKINLPLLISLGQATESEKKELENSVSKLLNRNEKEKMYKLIYKNGGLTETKLQLEAYRTKALSVLNKLENSENKMSLINFDNLKINF